MTLHTDNFYTRKTCRLCEGVVRQVLDLGNTPLANAYRRPSDISLVDYYPLSLAECSSCGHVQLEQVVKPEVLFTNYRYASGTSPSFREHFKTLAAEIILSSPEAISVLEIGSNDGTLLRALEDGGVPAVGIDPSPELAGPEVKTVKGFFTQKSIYEAWKLVGGEFTHLVANNVLAHIDDLKHVFELAHENDIQQVIFEVQYLGDLLRGGCFDLCYHEHLDYHSVLPLVLALPRWGYAVTRVDHIATHGGSIRVWASQLGTSAKADPRDLPALLQREVRGLRVQPRELGDLEESAWQQLALSIFKTKRQLGELLERYPKIAFYGAPAKLTTFASVLLERDPIYVVDDSKWKQGMMTPNGRWEIRPNSALTEQPPDAVLVTAWNFFDEVFTKLRAVGFHGPVIRPFPEVKLYL